MTWTCIITFYRSQHQLSGIRPGTGETQWSIALYITVLYILSLPGPQFSVYTTSRVNIGRTYFHTEITGSMSLIPCYFLQKIAQSESFRATPQLPGSECPKKLISSFCCHFLCGDWRTKNYSSCKVGQQQWEDKANSKQWYDLLLQLGRASQPDNPTSSVFRPLLGCCRSKFTVKLVAETFTQRLSSEPLWQRGEGRLGVREQRKYVVPLLLTELNKIDSLALLWRSFFIVLFWPTHFHLTNRRLPKGLFWSRISKRSL